MSSDLHLLPAGELENNESLDAGTRVLTNKSQWYASGLKKLCGLCVHRLVWDPAGSISDCDCKQHPVGTGVCSPLSVSFSLYLFASCMCFCSGDRKLGEAAFTSLLGAACHRGKLGCLKSKAEILKLWSNFTQPKVSVEDFDQCSTEVQLNVAMCQWCSEAPCCSGAGWELNAVCAVGTLLSSGTQKLAVSLPAASSVSAECLTGGALPSGFLSGHTGLVG